MADLPPVLTDPGRMEGVVSAIESIEADIRDIADTLVNTERTARDIGKHADKAVRSSRDVKNNLERIRNTERERLRNRKALTELMEKEAGIAGKLYKAMGNDLREADKEAMKLGLTLKRHLFNRGAGGAMGLSGTHSLGSALKSNFANLATGIRQLGGGLVGPGGMAGILLYGLAGKERFRGEAARAAHEFRMIGAASAGNLAKGMQSNAQRIEAVMGKAAREQFMGSGRMAAQAGFQGEDVEGGAGLSSGFFGGGVVSRAAALDTVLGKQMGSTMTDLGQIVAQTGGSFGALTEEMTSLLPLSQSLGISYDRLKQSLSSSLGTLGLTQVSYKGLLSTFKSVTASFAQMRGLSGLGDKQRTRTAGEFGMRGLQGLAQGLAGISDAELANMLQVTEGSAPTLGRMLRERVGLLGGGGEEKQRNRLSNFANFAGNEARKMLGVAPGTKLSEDQVFEAAAMLQKRQGLGLTSPEAALAAVNMSQPGGMTQANIDKLLKGMKSPQEALNEALDGVRLGINNMEAIMRRVEQVLLNLSISLVELMTATVAGILAFGQGPGTEGFDFYAAQSLRAAGAAGRRLKDATFAGKELFSGLGTITGLQLYDEKARAAQGAAHAVGESAAGGQIDLSTGFPGVGAGTDKKVSNFARQQLLSGIVENLNAEEAKFVEGMAKAQRDLSPMAWQTYTAGMAPGSVEKYRKLLNKAIAGRDMDPTRPGVQTGQLVVDPKSGQRFVMYVRMVPAGTSPRHDRP